MTPLPEDEDPRFRREGKVLVHMHPLIRSTAVALGAAVAFSTLTAAPAEAASCVGNLKKNLNGVGRVTYSICYKTGDNGAPYRKIQGTLYDTRTDSTQIKLTVKMFYYSETTASWWWGHGPSAGSTTFGTPWKVANDTAVVLSKM